MDSKLPGVEPVTLKLNPTLHTKSTKIDVSNDYGTPNLLHLYYVPFIPDDKKLDLDNLQEEFQSWNAWELGQGEGQLIKHVDNGNLPSDDSVASRTLRNNYRSKAIAFFRDDSQAWLSLTKENRIVKSVDTAPDRVYGDILSQLRSIHAEERLQGQLRVVLNAISTRVEPTEESKFFFSHVFYQYNADSRTFTPVVQDTTFTVTPQSAGDDNKKIDITLHVKDFKFNRSLWRQVRHEGEEAIELGKPIRKEMALDLYV